MLYQALIGGWPETVDDTFVKRVQAYALKAAREGKQQTSWTNPDPDYEAALDEFVRALLDESISRDFITSFGQFAVRTALLGALNGLSQLALKVLLPGVPDFYQGTEFWDLAFVDPDNRRPVDFAARARQLEPAAPDWATLAEHWRDGRIKFALTRALLRLRRELSEALRLGTYAPVEAAGPHAGHLIAFVRSRKDQSLVAVIGRHFAPLSNGGRNWPNGWSADIELPPGHYTDAIGTTRGTYTGNVALSELFATVPFAVLHRV
jgi:(1->4)-alpha-D-glucan 1-alpha-D-glucosylmutase